MFKKTIALALITTTLLTASSLQAVRWNSRDWTNFALGTGLGIIGTSIVQNSCRPCRQPVVCRETVVVRPSPVVVCREPVGCCPPARVVYETTTCCPRNNYDFVGTSTVTCVTSTCNSRTLTLSNGMVFEIAAGTLNWTGYGLTIYRDVTRTASNYVLSIGGYEFRANRLDTSPIPAPTPAPIPAPRPR